LPSSRKMIDVSPSNDDKNQLQAPSQWMLCSSWNDFQMASNKNEKETNFIVVPTTDLFRKFASRILPRGAFVVEIGCCNGFCTERILQSISSPEQYLGIDVGPQFIRECQAKFPEAHFEMVDVLMEWSRAQTLIETKFLAQQSGTTSKSLHVYVDIGGNRDVESLLVLLQIIQDKLQPSAMVVKSEALFAFGQKQGNGLATPEAWRELQALALKSLQQRRYKPKHYQPLRMPQRYNEDGVAICRYHNYDTKRGCLRHNDANNHCELDHTLCHSCKRPGHVAFECPTQQMPLLDTLLLSSSNHIES
jgi:predicted O-methyltransferase YrrM